jgi:hypothetical protein
MTFRYLFIENILYGSSSNISSISSSSSGNTPNEKIKDCNEQGIFITKYNLFILNKLK